MNAPTASCDIDTAVPTIVATTTTINIDIVSFLAITIEQKV